MGGEEVRWKTVRTYGKILATPLQPVCLKITSESENELLSMNCKDKCAIKLLHGLPKLE